MDADVRGAPVAVGSPMSGTAFAERGRPCRASDFTGQREYLAVPGEERLAMLWPSPVVLPGRGGRGGPSPVSRMKGAGVPEGAASFTVVVIMLVTVRVDG